MATATIVQARIIRNQNNAPPVIRGGAERPDIKETASQTYAAGAPVYYDSNGTIAVCTTSSNKINSKIAGFALAAATGTTGAQVRYRAIQPGDVLLCNLKGPSTTTTALTQQGAQCNFDISSGNMVANVDTVDTTKFYGIIISLYDVANGFGDGDTVGDTNGRVLVLIPDQSVLQR